MSQSKKLYIGIDPGQGGGIAHIGTRMKAHKCPRTPEDMSILLGIIVDGYAPDDVVLYMEKVWAFPFDTPKTSFGLGKNYGRWEGIVGSYGIHMHYITPKQWMSRFNIPKFKDRQDRKRYLKMRAQKLYSGVKVTLYNADAILITNFAKNN